MTEISESDTLKKIRTLEKLIMEVGDANVIGLFSILMKFADNKTGKCYPSQRTIRELAKFGSNNTLNKYLKVLIEHGYVNKVSNKASGEANIYYLNWLGAEETNSETNTPRQKMTTPSSNNEHPLVKYCRQNSTQILTLLSLTLIRKKKRFLLLKIIQRNRSSRQ